MASFDKAILPGGEGKIKIRINTKHYRGKRSWGASVYTNDPQHQKTYVRIKANVKAPIFASSYRVSLRALEGESITREIQIRGDLPEELAIEPLHFTLEGIANYTIEEVEKGRLFKILFYNVPGPPKSVRGRLDIKTNYPEKPLLSIQVSVNIMKKE